MSLICEIQDCWIRSSSCKSFLMKFIAEYCKYSWSYFILSELNSMCDGILRDSYSSMLDWDMIFILNVRQMYSSELLSSVLVLHFVLFLNTLYNCEYPVLYLRILLNLVSCSTMLFLSVNLDYSANISRIFTRRKHTERLQSIISHNEKLT